MPQKITETALLQCDKGAVPSQLKVTSQNFCRANNKLIATEKDKQAETNVPNFEVCAVTKSKCSPALIMWQELSQKDTINDLKFLTEKSTCQCSKGGKVSLKNTGHIENHSVE